MPSSSEYFLARSSKLAPRFGLFQDVFGLLANFGDFGVGFADGLEQNVLDVNAIIDLVFVNMRVVVGPQSLVAYRGGGAEFREVKQRVAG